MAVKAAAFPDQPAKGERDANQLKDGGHIKDENDGDKGADDLGEDEAAPWSGDAKLTGPARGEREATLEARDNQDTALTRELEASGRQAPDDASPGDGAD